MTEEDHDKLLEIRKRGKIGRLPVSAEEHAFCDKMYKRFPKEYAAVEAEMMAWLRGLNWWELI